MTAQLPLTLVPAGAIEIGQVACLVQDVAGGRVFAGGELVFAWDAGDDLGRRLAAVQLVRIKGARAVRVAEGFGVNTETLRRWEGAVTDVGVAALGSGKRGPKGPSRLSQELVADIPARRRSGASLRAIAAAVGVSEATVRRALPSGRAAGSQGAATNGDVDQGDDACAAGDSGDAGAGKFAAVDLPVLPAAADRSGDRAAARWGQMTHAEPMFAPAARVPLAGLLLAIPALQATGLLPCATTVFGQLR
ncbi:MAG TPA: hypothetical protein VIJ07_15455 [Dermatophilaceae bacterium]